MTTIKDIILEMIIAMAERPAGSMLDDCMERQI
jgi:hypothetical protein